METQVKRQKNAVDQSIKDAKYSITYGRKSLKELRLAKRILGKIDLSDVSYLYTGSCDDALSIIMTLANGKENSKLVHKLAQRFQCAFVKAKNYDGTSLSASGKFEYTLSDKLLHVSITVQNYVPQTCTLETVEVPLTASEIEYAQQQAQKTTRTVTKVNCVDVETK